MTISDNEARIRAWVELQQNRSERIIQLTSDDVKFLLKIIDEEREEIYSLELKIDNLLDGLSEI